MRRLSSLFLISAILTVLATCVMLAQQPKPKAPSSEPQDVAIFSSETNLVPLYASVVDKNGKLLTNIPQSAFKIMENGVEQPIKIFRREDVPVSMGIIIDNSGSMRDKRTKVAASSLALVKESNPQDEVFIFNFNDDVYLDQSFTNDIKKLEEALDKFDTRGGTAMRNAVNL